MGGCYLKVVGSLSIAILDIVTYTLLSDLLTRHMTISFAWSCQHAGRFSQDCISTNKCLSFLCSVKVIKVTLDASEWCWELYWSRLLCVPTMLVYAIYSGCMLNHSVPQDSFWWIYVPEFLFAHWYTSRFPRDRTERQRPLSTVFWEQREESSCRFIPSWFLFWAVQRVRTVAGSAFDMSLDHLANSHAREVGWCRWEPSWHPYNFDNWWDRSMARSVDPGWNNGFIELQWRNEIFCLQVRYLLRMVNIAMTSKITSTSDPSTTVSRRSGGVSGCLSRGSCDNWPVHSHSGWRGRLETGGLDTKSSLEQ